MKLEKLRYYAKSNKWSEYQFIERNKLIGFSKIIRVKKGFFASLFSRTKYRFINAKVIVYYTSGTCRVVLREGSKLGTDELYRKLDGTKIKQVLKSPIGFNYEKI